MSFQWTEDLATGVTVIDVQHREIFRRVNTLHDACRLGGGKDEAVEMLGFLDGYVLSHFKDEEEIQVKYSYPDYPAHKAQHEQFAKDLEALKEKFIEEGPTLSMVHTLNRVVSEWLVRHIKKTDRALADFMKTKGHKG